MRSVRLLVIFSASVILVVTSVGCEVFPHQLQPQQLWKLNRGSSYSEDPFFSVSDPLPQSGFVAEATENEGESTSKSDRVTTLDTSVLDTTSLASPSENPFDVPE